MGVGFNGAHVYLVVVNVVNHGQHCFGKVQEPDDPSVRANLPGGQF